MQVEGRFDDDSVKKMVAETIGYVEYTNDAGEIYRPEIQYARYCRGNGKFVYVDLLQ